MRNLVFLILFTLFFLQDVIIDLNHGVPLSHITHELILFLIGLGAISWQVWVISQKDKHITNLGARLLETKKEYLDWKKSSQSSSTQLRELIDHQFSIWHLSYGEKDIALLLIKGLSMKEIAEIRNTHEKTVRQQATTIYKKSGLSGRQELAAFFLEDILSFPIPPV